MKRLVKVAWFIVLGMMLTAAAWSISHRLIAWGMAPTLAYGISLMFDSAGLICAEYSRRAVLRGTPAGLPRLSILAFVATSGVITYTHGHSIGGMPAGFAFASTSALVELLFELHRRDARDAERAARGLVPEMLPRVPLIAWLMYPRRSWKTLRAAVGVRLDHLDPMRADTPEPLPDNHVRAVGTVRAAVRAAADTMPPDATAEDIADQLAHAGIDVSEDTVRSVLADKAGQQDSTSQPVVHLAPDTEDTIADTVRRLVRQGVRDTDKVLSAVRAQHGQSVARSTVTRTLRRVA
ncbi:DUF2637 domain-containing protein [Embleya sp. NPDC001921]